MKYPCIALSLSLTIRAAATIRHISATSVDLQNSSPDIPVAADDHQSWTHSVRFSQACQDEAGPSTIAFGTTFTRKPDLANRYSFRYDADEADDNDAQDIVDISPRSPVKRKNIPKRKVSPIPINEEDRPKRNTGPTGILQQGTLSTELTPPHGNTTPNQRAKPPSKSTWEPFESSPSRATLSPDIEISSSKRTVTRSPTKSSQGLLPKGNHASGPPLPSPPALARASLSRERLHREIPPVAQELRERMAALSPLMRSVANSSPAASVRDHLQLSQELRERMAALGPLMKDPAKSSTAASLRHHIQLSQEAMHRHPPANVRNQPPL